MVLVLEDGSRLEMRSVPRFREVEAYIEEQRRSGGARRSGTGSQATGGFGEPNRQSA
jgi:hypothetical protein